jgi:hypothetical protein
MEAVGGGGLEGRVGKGISFRKNSAEKTRNGSVIPRKKVLIPRFTEESIPRLGTEENGMSFTKNPAPPNRIDRMFLSRDMLRNGIPNVCFDFFSTERYSEHFLLCRPVRNGIPKVEKGPKIPT